MTSQEVRALIDAKIKGQGTNVDAGSVLPAILNGILDLIDSGGGGGTSDAVQYIPQELTETQQMQARKNQGLYYSEETPAGTITWDGNTEGKESFNFESFQPLTLYKIADSPAYIPADKISAVLDASGNPITIWLGEGAEAGFDLISGTIVAGFEYDGDTTYGLLILDSPQSTEPAPYDGLTGVYVTENVRTIEYDAYGETVHQIPAKYIPQTIPTVKMEVPSMGGLYYNMAQLNVNQYVPNRDVVFSVEGHTVENIYVSDVINGGADEQEGNTYTFSSGGLYWVQLQLEDDTFPYPYVCAMVYVESGI